MERVINDVQLKKLLGCGASRDNIVSAGKGDDECSKMASISQQMNVFEKENRELRARANDLQESSKKAAIKRDQDCEDRHVSARYTS